MSIAGTLASSVGEKNPIRYRGYYYDTETNLYYLNSRYYDPETGRFISADVVAEGGNLYTYCQNDPINRSDESGCLSTKWKKILTAVAVVAVVVATVALTVATCGAGAVALAGVGTTIGVGAAAGTALTVAAVAAGVGVATTAALASDAIKEAIDKNHHNGSYTVYTLSDSEGIQYVGRTKNYDARIKAHKLNVFRKNLKPDKFAPGLSYEEARGLEELLMSQKNTLHKGSMKNNQIHGINEKNINFDFYIAAGKEAYNRITNEILNLFGI